MKTSRFSEQQIAFILKQAEDGTTVEEVCRKAGISVQTYYRWRSKYGGLMPSEMKWLKQLEEENVRLKHLVANLSLDKEMLQGHTQKHRSVVDPQLRARHSQERVISGKFAMAHRQHRHKRRPSGTEDEHAITSHERPLRWDISILRGGTFLLCPYNALK
jgi:putative transposase